jgi:hypothetical protein
MLGLGNALLRAGLGGQMRGALESFPPSGNGLIALRKIRKAFAEAQVSRSFSKSSIARRHAPAMSSSPR